MLDPRIRELSIVTNFWTEFILRRTFSWSGADMLVVSLPLQIIVIVLFAQTNGAIQGSFGIMGRTCAPIAQLPVSLDPSPPEGFNSIVECRISFLGFNMARTLTVSKVTQQGSVTTSVFESYSLGVDGRPMDAFSTDWIAILVFFAYLISMEYRSGATVGKRLVGIRTVDTSFPSRLGVPLRKAVLRPLAMQLGIVPIPGGLIVAFLLAQFRGIDPAEILSSRVYLSFLAIAAAIYFAWIVWIIVSVSRKRDPIYDRLAHTAVLRT